MKTIRCLFIVMALALMLVIPALAQAPAPGEWHTGFTIRNMSFHSETYVSIDFHDHEGYVRKRWYTPYGDYLQPKSSIFLYAGNIEGLPEETTAVVNSFEPVAVVVNLASDWPDKTESAYVSMRIPQTSAELFAPGIYKNYYWNSSAVRVMNTARKTSQEDPITCVRVRYYRLGESSPTYTEYRTVEARAGYTFLQEDLPALGTSFIGSAVVDSVDQMGTCTDGIGGQQLSAITNISIDPGPSIGNPNAWRLHAIHNPIVEGSHLAYMPVLANDYHDNKSAATILNMRDSGQWVRLLFSGSTYSEKYIQPLSSELWYVPNEGPPVGWVGAGTAVCITRSGGPETTNCEIVATVNQINEDSGNFASYNGFTVADGQRISHLPVVVKDYTAEDYTTTVTCMNVDDHWVVVCLALDNLQIRCEWIIAGGSHSWYLGNEEWVPDGYNKSGYAYAYYVPENIICLAQQNADSASEDGDWLTTYNGISDEYP